MTRFRKGTLDHDGDGRKGGSLPKGDDMAKAATTRTRKRTATTTRGDKAPEAQPTLAKRQEAAEEQFATADATAAADARLRLAVSGF